MTPQLEALFATSLRIREYQAAARTIEALAHLAQDPQVKATLRQQVAELDETAEGWRRRQEADLIETIPSAVTQAVEARTGPACGFGVEPCQLSPGHEGEHRMRWWT